MVEWAASSNAALIAVVSGAGAILLWWQLRPSSRRAARHIGRKNTIVRKDTLIPLLQEHMVPMEKIVADYPALTSIVRVLIGIVPRCDAYLEIWPAAFRTYNLIVPNLMNVPFKQLGVGPGWGEGSALAGLAMYVVSRTAECSYCSAHTCSYALRRGTSTKAVISGSGGNEVVLWQLSEAESATVAVARALGKVPCELTDAERARLVEAVGPATAETVVFSACAMGYLNKVMDSLGVEIEEEAYLETRDLIGQDFAATKVGSMLDANRRTTSAPSADSLWRKLSLLPLTPGAIMWTRSHARGVPDTWPAVGTYLEQQTGFSFQFLAALSQTSVSRRCVSAIATALCVNLDPATSVVSLRVKALAALLFAHVAGPDSALPSHAAALASAHGATRPQLEACRSLAAGPVRSSPSSDFPPELASLGADACSWLLLARAVAPSPAQVSEQLVSTLLRQRASPQGVVELVNFVALWQLILRVSAFFHHPGDGKVDTEDGARPLSGPGAAGSSSSTVWSTFA